MKEIKTIRCPFCNCLVKVRTEIGFVKYGYCSLCQGKVKVVKKFGKVTEIVYQHVDKRANIHLNNVKTPRREVNDEKKKRKDGRVSSSSQSNAETGKDNNCKTGSLTESPSCNASSRTDNQNGAFRDLSKSKKNKQETSDKKKLNRAKPKEPRFTDWKPIS